MIKIVLYDTGKEYIYEFDPDNPPEWINRNHPFSIVLSPNIKEEDSAQTTPPVNTSA